MTVKEISIQLKRNHSKPKMILIFCMTFIYFFITSNLSAPLASNITLKSIAITTAFTLMYTVCIEIGNRFSLARQVKKRIKHIICDEIYFCDKKRKMTMNHNFFLIRRNKTITKFPYEYYQTEKECNITMANLDGQNHLNIDGKVYHLSKVK